MLEYIQNQISNDKPISIPNYNNFLKEQKKYISDKYRFFQSTIGHESGIIRQMRYMLGFVDMEYLDRCTNNYDRYMNHLRFIIEQVQANFNKLEEGMGFRGLLFKKEDDVEEFLIPIADVNTLINLPLETVDWNIWKYVRPLRLWSCNTNEFTTNILSDRVQYIRKPAYSVEFIDIVALSLKYYLWYTYYRKTEPNIELTEQIPEQYFLHKYVLCPIVWDLGNIWLIQKFIDVLFILDKKDIMKYDSSNLQLDSQYGAINLTCKYAYADIYNVFNSIKKNLNPKSFCSSTVLFDGSIYDRCRLTIDRLTIMADMNDSIKGRYLRWLRDKDLLLLILLLWNKSTNSSLFKPALKNILILLDRWKQSINQTLRSSSLRELFQTDLSMCSMLTTALL